MFVLVLESEEKNYDDVVVYRHSFVLIAWVSVFLIFLLLYDLFYAFFISFNQNIKNREFLSIDHFYVIGIYMMVYFDFSFIKKFFQHAYILIII